MFHEGPVRTRTISEVDFGRLCANRGVGSQRISKSVARIADYRVSLGSTTTIVEVKQLDPNDDDRELAEAWGTPRSPGAVAPSDRVQGLLDDGYSQIRRSSEGKWPTMIIVYDKSGAWNWIGSVTVAKAMFGSYGIVLGLQPDQTIDEIDRGYLGQRKVTKDTFRALSAAGALEHREPNTWELACYHNPFATMPINRVVLAKLAKAQFVHPNRHDRGFAPWEPKQIET